MSAKDYAVGQTIHVNYKRALATPSIPLELCILDMYTPFTMAAVCKVQVVRQAKNIDAFVDDICILKLYDRRFARNIREDHDEGQPHSDQKEVYYAEYLRNPSNVPLSRDVIHKQPKQGIENGVFEGHVHSQCEKMFENEAFAYQQIVEAQGVHIPRLLGFVEYHPLELAQQDPEGPSSYHRSLIPGVLLEYIPSSVTVDHLLLLPGIPSHAVQLLCQRALSLIQTLEANYEVLNKDISPRNILVACTDDQFRQMTLQDPAHDLETVRMVVIDFGLSRIRYPDETDDEWAVAKDQLYAGHKIQSELMHLLSVNPDGHTWKFQSSKLWRPRTAEEQEAYEDDPWWGLHDGLAWSPTLVKALWLLEKEETPKSVWDLIPHHEDDDHSGSTGEISGSADSAHETEA